MYGIGSPVKPVEAHNLEKSFGQVRAVRGVSLHVDRGEIFGLLGPNGAGKTTTIRMITGIISPDRGRVYIMGYDVLKDPLKAKSHVGVVPEISAPYVDLSAWDNLMLAGRIYHVEDHMRRARAKDLLKMLNLSEAMSRKVKGFSKGMRQRLLLAMALISDPGILILDEPTSGLDIISTRMVRSLITDLRREGKSIFLTTHNIEEAGILCDRIAVINKGRIVAEGSPEDLRINFEEFRSVKIILDRDLKGIEEALGSFDVLIQGRKIFITCRRDEVDEVLRRTMKLAEDLGARVEEVQTTGPSFEEIFMKLIRGKER